MRSGISGERARLDHHERRDQDRGPGEQHDRPRRPPADAAGFDQRVDQQHQPAGDRQRAGQVIAGVLLG
jgi:hypothetical protein